MDKKERESPTPFVKSLLGASVPLRARPNFWPTVPSRGQRNYQKSDPSGDHYYVGCLGQTCVSLLILIKICFDCTEFMAKRSNSLHCLEMKQCLHQSGQHEDMYLFRLLSGTKTKHISTKKIKRNMCGMKHLTENLYCCRL